MATTSGKRKPVVHSSIKKKKMPTVPATATEQSYISPNRFTPLTNHNENQTDEINSRSNYQQRIPWKKHFTQPNVGNKIATIINRRVMNVEIKKTSPTLTNSSRAPSNKNNRCTHKVKIIGDSHLKGSAARINQHLNTKFEVCSFIKPGACTNQIVHSQKIEFRSLGKKDAIVINGGTNDIGNNSTRRNETIVKMAQFMQKYSNTNIILVNIPQRYDLEKDSRINLEIQALSTKLGKIASLFSHLTLIDIDFNRKYFTKHGLQLNNAGKEGLAKLIATHIDKLVNDINKTKPTTVLNWKEETTNVRISVTNNHKPKQKLTEDNLSTAPDSPFQFHNNQDNKTESELPRKTSSRQKKAPVTRSKDFLWQM